MLKFAHKVKGWREQKHNVAICVVVRTQGGSPRGIGSLMAVNENGDMVGSVSAGCAEGMVVRAALNCIKTGQMELVGFTQTRDKEWEVGTPCGGDVDVLVMPFSEDVHGEMLRCIISDTPYTYLVYLPGGGPLSEEQAVVSSESTVVSWMNDIALEAALDAYEASAASPQGGLFSSLGAEVFVCSYKKRPTIVCVGAVHIAACLVSMAGVLDYSTVVVDPRSAFIKEERFASADHLRAEWPQEAFPALGINANTAICVLSHDPKIDVPALYESLATDAFYIGCLGHAETLLDRRKALESLGVADTQQLARVFGPIGAYIGGRTPAEIALSILAQIQAVRYGRIHHAEQMPGHRLCDFTDQSVAKIAEARTLKRKTHEVSEQ